MQYFSADLIFTNTNAPLTNKAIVTNDEGQILDITDLSNVSADIQNIKGAIVPGFVNAHCHLELSHFKNKLPTGKGLIDFVNSVVTLRDSPKDEIEEAIKKADEEMYLNGIMAVGDISNKSDTAEVKKKSNISYYTFIEMFDLLQESNARNTFEQYMEVYHSHSNENGNRKSCVPHAPYSVSKNLFKLIKHQNTKDETVSVHNQETLSENMLFLEKKGGFIDLFSGFGADFTDFKATGQPSIDYALAHMNPKHKTLFIHNTLSDERDIKAAHNWSDRTYWITCPNANLFIENRLPHYPTFINENAKMGVGTDSLSSNWELSILEEIKTIQKYQSFLDTATLIKWSSYHSAEALGYSHLGSIEVGKQPGLIALEGLSSAKRLLKEVKAVKRLI